MAADAEHPILQASAARGHSLHRKVSWPVAIIPLAVFL
jgi:hypothetical protein